MVSAPRSDSSHPIANEANDVPYRFPRWKDATWNSFDRHKERYEIIRPYLGEDLVGAELGVYKGGFGEFLLPHCRKLYLVDPWYRLGGYWQSGLPLDSRVDTVINILTVYREQIHAGRIELIIDFAASFLATACNNTFDFIYLDGSHKYDQTKLELESAIGKMKRGGIILGDDYDPDPTSKQHGVFRAVNEFVAERGLHLAFSVGRQWGLFVST